MLKRIICLFFVFLLLITGLNAQQKRPITYQDFIKLKIVSAPQFSPDGNKIAFVLREYSLETNSSQSHIWIYDLLGNSCYQLTNGLKNESQPSFSPDGKTLAFISNRDGTNNIWLISLDGGEAQKITSLSTGAFGPIVWSADGKSVLFTSYVFPNCKTDDENSARLTEIENDGVSAVLYDKLMIRHWNTFFDGTFSHLFMVTIKDKVAKDLTPGEINVPPIALGSDCDYQFSPDQKEIAYVANADKMEAISTNNDVFVMDLKNLKTTKISNSLGGDCQPKYSPDGKYLAFVSQERACYETDRYRIMIYNRRNGDLKEITKGFCYSVFNYEWTAKSDKIYFNVEEKGYYRLYSVDLDGRMRKVSEDANVFDFSLSKKGNKIAFLSGNFKLPPELFLMDLSGEKTKKLTAVNNNILEKLLLGDYEEFWFDGDKRTKVHGFLLTPPDFNPSKKYPLVLLIHGGPQNMWSNAFGYRWCPQMFASGGYVIAMINPRGSSGYGQAFQDEINGDWGGRAYEDLMKGVDYLIENYGFIDANNIGAAGGSFGGYMTNWIEGQTDRFKCLITHSGIYDLKSQYGATEELWFPEWDFRGTPWDNPEMYEKWSPSSYVKNFKTPMLIIHGQLDYRVPVEEGLQMFTALQRLGIPSKFLYFPDECHWILKPKNQELWYKTFNEWLDKWLKAGS